MGTTEGIKGITEVAVQQPTGGLVGAVNDIFGCANQTLATIFDGTARVVAPLAQTAADIRNSVQPQYVDCYYSPYAFPAYAQPQYVSAPVYYQEVQQPIVQPQYVVGPQPSVVNMSPPIYDMPSGLPSYPIMYDDNTLSNLYMTMRQMPIVDKYAEINAVTGVPSFGSETFGGSVSSMNNLLANGYNGFGQGYGYYGNVSQAPRTNYQNPSATVNNPINNTSQNGQSATTWYEAYRRSTNLTDEQRALAAKHERISRLTDPTGSEYPKIRQSVANLKNALETNNEDVAENILRKLAKNPEELAAVELLYSADTPGSSLRKDIVRNFNYWGFGWMGNRTAKADEMLGLLNKVAFEHPANFALAMANATDGWGAYEDTVSSLALDPRLSTDFLYCANEEYTGRTGRTLLNDVTKKWTSYNGNKAAIQQKLSI